MSSYKCISSFGPSVSDDPSNNPLTYCLDQTMNSSFVHGSTAKTIGAASGKNCQAFMAQYCANNWDNVCEVASNNRSRNYQNNLKKCGTGIEIACTDLTAGEILLQNTASYKYLSQLGGECRIEYEQFDPTVASSPLVAYLSNEHNKQCVPVYEVDPKTIDSDPVMNKILAKPIIAWAILVNIYNTAKRKGTLNGLQGTKIYKLFMSDPFQNYLRQMAKIPSIRYKCGCN